MPDPVAIRRAADWLAGTWRILRDDNREARRAYLAGAVDMLRDLGILTADEQQQWIERSQECPGHEDGRAALWCAYKCPWSQGAASVATGEEPAP